MDKKNVAYAYSVILALQKKEILPFVKTRMNLKDINAKWNKLDTERQVLYDFTYRFTYNLIKMLN